MNENLGAVFLEVRGKLDKLAGDFQKAFNEASKHTDTFGGKLAATFSNPKIIGAVGALGTAVGGMLMHAGDKLETAQKQLEAAAAAAGIPMEELKAKTKGLDSAMENLGITNAKTAAAEQIFVQGGRPANEIMKDMAVAADVAKAKHIDLSAAANALIKTYAGSSKFAKQFGLDAAMSSTTAANEAKKHEAALSQLSKAEDALKVVEEKQALSAQAVAAGHGKVKVSAQQAFTASQALEKAHQAVAAAQDKVTTSQDALNKGVRTGADLVTDISKRVHGQAAASMDTWGGKIEVLKTKFEDFTAHIGKKVGPAIAGLAPIITAAAMIMSSGAGTMIASGIGAAISWVGSMATMAASTIAAAATMIISLLPIIVPIMAIIAVAYLLYRNWDTVWGFIKDVVKTAWDWIKHHLDLIIAIVAAPLLPLYELWKHWKEIWGEIQDIIHSVAGFIGDRINDITGFFEGLWRFIENIWNKIKGIFDAITGGIGSLVSSLNPFSGGGFHIPGFAAGGTVPGPYGAARLVVAHGGEVIGKPGIGGGSGGGGNTYVTVEGSVVSQRELMDIMKAGQSDNNRYNGSKWNG